MHYTKKLKLFVLTGLSVFVLAGMMTAVLPANPAFAANSPKGNDTGGHGGSTGSTPDVKLDNPSNLKYYCGGKDRRIYTSINLGCAGKGNATVDLAFAIIRFLSAGVGLVVIASIIFGGIQYTLSRGDPQATAAAVNRIRNSLFALLLFIFAYAILGYLIPKGFLQL